MSAVHLTFDNGPHPEVTARVLDVLDKHRATATFFVVGKKLATLEGMAVAECIRRRGHRLGNHSYHHETPLGADQGSEAVERELTATQALLDRVWDGPRWFRPFGAGGALGDHLLSPESVVWLVDGGLTCFLWNSGPGVWKDARGWVERGLCDADRLDHAVVVLHDVLGDAMANLDEFLRRLTARGHRFTADFPASCLPIVNGERRPGLEAYVRGEKGQG
jgi:peptidoglycan/xylan/chitin deacetylase (PgdA/CDA1 family)